MIEKVLFKLKEKNIVREVVFIDKNIDRWKKFEQAIRFPKSMKPDYLADLFVQITDDLAYSRTYYNKSDTTRYLNSLALKAHHLIYKNKREKSNRIVKFWMYDFPMTIRETYKHLAISSIIFILSGLIGIISAKNDPEFIRLVMGDHYVDKTLYNIEKGDPMAVYKSANEVEMFLGITINNVRVSFYAFIFGVIISIGTGYILFFNGIMVGSFMFFMYQHGVIYDALLAVWLHGTIEIFSILVAGAAGIVMGNSILFPGTYSRLTSFKMGVKKGLKLVIGLVPFFIIAGFIEGFITRYTNAPDVFRIFVIGMSIILIIWYFFIYPNRIYKKTIEDIKNTQTYGAK